MTLPSITRHAIERVGLRWRVHDPVQAERLIHETVELGRIVPHPDGSLRFVHRLDSGFTRIVVVRCRAVVTVACRRSRAYDRRERQATLIKHERAA